MYSKQIKDNNTVLVLNEPITIYDNGETLKITDFTLNTLNEFEEEIYYTINYIMLMEASGVDLRSNIKNEYMKIRISYNIELDQIELNITYGLPNNGITKRKYVLNEEEFIKNIIDEMILSNEKYIYGVSMIRKIADEVKEEIFYSYIDNNAFIVNEHTINTTIKCMNREHDTCLAIANRFMYIPEDDCMILCETIESADLTDFEYVDLEFISNSHLITIERASLASRSKGKVKYICLVTRNATIKVEDTDEKQTVFSNKDLNLPLISDYTKTKSTEDLATFLYDNNNQDKINLFYKTNSFIDMMLININAYLL